MGGEPSTSLSVSRYSCSSNKHENDEDILCIIEQYGFPSDTLVNVRTHKSQWHFYSSFSEDLNKPDVAIMRLESMDKLEEYCNFIKVLEAHSLRPRITALCSSIYVDENCRSTICDSFDVICCCD